MSPARPEAPGFQAGRDGVTLEQVLDQLESAVRRLADQSAPLERVVGDWERAQALARDAERRLDEVERRLHREREEGGGDGPPA